MGKRRPNNDGSVYKESSTGLWVAEISLPDGKRKRKRSKKQSVVREWLKTTLGQLEQGIYVEDSKVTVAAFLDRFITDIVEHTLRPKTIDSYKYLINNHIKPEIGSIRLTDLRPNHLQALYSRKLEAGLSRRTVHYIHAVIRRALNYAVKWSLIIRNPTDVVTPPVPTKKTPQTLSEDQARMFLQAVQEHRWYPIYCVAMCGLRMGEILGLHVEDVSIPDKTIHIRHTAQQVRGKIILGEPKTEKSKRTVALPDFVCEVLQHHLTTIGKKEGLVFTTSTGKPIAQRNLLGHFHQTLERLGIPRMPFHNLRHTAATLLLLRNVHPKIVQEMLGHSSIMLTLDTYSHVISNIQKEAALQMDEVFRKKEGELP